MKPFYPPAICKIVSLVLSGIYPLSVKFDYNMRVKENKEEKNRKKKEMFLFGYNTK